MLAILEDAVAVFVKSVSGGAVKQSDARAARVWLESRDRTLPFTFEYVCEVLGLESDYIRRGLLCLRASPSQAAKRFAVRHHGSAANGSPPRMAVGG